MIHEQYVFMVPIVGLSLILIWRATPGRMPASLITTVGIYTAVAVDLIAVTYISMGVLALGHGNILKTIAWARGHASHGMWVRFSSMSPLWMLVGFVRVIFGISFLAARPT